MRGRTPLTGRPGHGDVYTAIPEGERANRVVEHHLKLDTTEHPKPVVVSTGDGRVRNVNIAADPSGRLWVVWTRQTERGLRVFASRSDKAANDFGPPVSERAPAGTIDSQALDAIARSDGVDIVGTFTGPHVRGGRAAIYFTRLEAG
jgi:hypothetical protein